MHVCWTHRPESKLSHRHRRTDLGPFDRSFLFPKPLNCLPDSLRKKPCKQVARPNCASTRLYAPRYGAYLPNTRWICAINVAFIFSTRYCFLLTWCQRLKLFSECFWCLHGYKPRWFCCFYVPASLGYTGDLFLIPTNG